MERLPSGSDFIILATGAAVLPEQQQKLPEPPPRFVAFASGLWLIKLEYDSDKMLYNVE